MKYEITKDFEFSASHIVEDLPLGHKCTKLHGHNYVVRLRLGAKALDETGFVIDYGELDEFKWYLDEYIDHQHLNDVIDVNPTAENLAEFFFAWCLEEGWPIKSASVSETPKTSATYKP